MRNISGFTYILGWKIIPGQVVYINNTEILPIINRFYSFHEKVPINEQE